MSGIFDTSWSQTLRTSLQSIQINYYMYYTERIILVEHSLLANRIAYILCNSHQNMKTVTAGECMQFPNKR